MLFMFFLNTITKVFDNLITRIHLHNFTKSIKNILLKFLKNIEHKGVNYCLRSLIIH
jgi:hypothetical protein